MKDGGPHRTHIYRGSISGASGLEAASKFDPPDDDMAAWGPGYSQPEPSYHQPKAMHHRNVMDMLDAKGEFEGKGTRERGKSEAGPRLDDRDDRVGWQFEKFPSTQSDDELDRHARRQSIAEDAPGK